MSVRGQPAGFGASRDGVVPRPEEKVLKIFLFPGVGAVMEALGTADRRKI